MLLSGIYKGYTDADCTYFQNRYTDDESLNVTANGDGTLAVLFESAAWGTFKVDKATVRKNGDNYTFTGEGTVSMGMGDNVKDYAFTMTGESNAAKGRLLHRIQRACRNGRTYRHAAAGQGSRHRRVIT